MVDKEKQIQEMYEQIKYGTGSYDADARSCAEILYEYCGYRKLEEDVKHGHWVDRGTNNGQVYCSICGALEAPSASHYKSPICPLCGAKMDGRGEKQ